MQTSEWLLTAAVILVPLAIAVTVTLWSLEQARYRPRKRRPPGIRRDESTTEGGAPPVDGAPP